MRLINTTTLQVEEFLGHEIPQYAILSHTWQADEVTFQDLQRPDVVNKKGYKKIRKCCEMAAADGYFYCWVDTCCMTLYVDEFKVVLTLSRYRQDEQCRTI